MAALMEFICTIFTGAWLWFDLVAIIAVALVNILAATCATPRVKKQMVWILDGA